MELAIGFIIGFVVGAAAVLIVTHIRSRATERSLADAQQQLRDAFASLAGDALKSNSQMLAERNAAELDGKKTLIDQTVWQVQQNLEQVRQTLARIEAERKEDFGKMASAVGRLTGTADELHKMLASTQRRGAWGERMAEDVLRLVGMQERINYVKQSSEQAASGRPDFTFFLPNEITANMDVKFPLESYKAYLDADGQAAASAAVASLTAAVRGHIKAVAGRGYVDLAKGTVPYVIVFIPSEQIFSLTLASDPDMIDFALSQKVVLASPLTLYAMLSVVRQAAENANLMKTASRVVELLGQFDKQLQQYNEAMDKLGDKIRQTAEQYQAVRTTRTNMLQKPLDQLAEIRESGKLSDGAGQ